MRKMPSKYIVSPSKWHVITITITIMLLSFMMWYALTKQIHIKYFSNIAAATASRESFTISKSINSTNTTADLTAGKSAQ